MKNRIIYFLLIIIVIEGLFLAFRPNLSSIKVDSGWDSDYGGSDFGGSDFGGSDWGGSDWSSSDYDYSSSSSSYSGSSSSNGNGSFGLLFLYFSRYILAFIIIVIYLNYKKNNKGNNSVTNICKDIDGERLDTLLSLLNTSSLDELKEKLFSVFVDVQMAWMEFDYDALSKLCGDELYNSYKADLEVLKLKNGKNIMNSFNMNKMSIYNYINETNYIDLYVNLSASFYDYVIDTTNDKVIRGNKNNILTNNYILVYRKYKTILDTCPSCGAPISNKSNQKCEHCGSKIVNNNDNYILIRKGRT